MTNIITVLSRHYIGTVAEIAGITGVCGDTAYETDTDIYKHWNGAAWVTSGLPYYVERLPESSDFSVGDFTCNGVWQVNGLDLSAIVPAGAIMARLKVNVLDDAAGSTLTLRRDAVKSYDSIVTLTPAANIPGDKSEFIALDTDRLLDYNASNLVFTSINVTVLGWTIPRCQ